MGLGARAIAALAALVLLGGCAWPTYDQSTLKAIRTESRRLMAMHSIDVSKRWASVPESQWPPVIASLKPDSVIVHKRNVEILIKPSFDGGWGYEVPVEKTDLMMPPECYSELGQGVFWHSPC